MLTNQRPVLPGHASRLSVSEAGAEFALSAQLGREPEIVIYHVVRSISIIFEFPRGADYQNSDHPYVYNS